MKKILILLCLLTISISAYAKKDDGIYRCIGMGNEGEIVNVLLDADTKSLHIFNEIHQIMGTYRNADGGGMYTEKYHDYKGFYIYLILEISGNKITIYQRNVITGQYMTYMPVVCNKV